MFMLDNDFALGEIVTKTQNLQYVKSIVLFGSKAKNNLIIPFLPKTDYDVFVILPFVLIPLYYKKLKFIEMTLYNEFGVDASINPLPLIRLKRSKGNLLFFKMINEGITLYGRDYLKTADVGSITDIDPDEFISYYFSSVRFLIKDLESFDRLTETEVNNILYDIAKSVLYCSELLQYIEGIYIQDKIVVLKETLNSKYLCGEYERFRNIVCFTLEIYCGRISSTINLSEYWFLAKEYSIFTSNILFNKLNLGIDTESSLDQYNMKKFSIVKSLQYAVLSCLKKNNFPIITLMKRTSVERKIYLSAYYLMKSIDVGFEINSSDLINAKNALLSAQLIDETSISSLNSYRMWIELKFCLLDNWDIACGKSII